MVPALFGVSVAQVNLMIDTIFASFLKSGSISWLYFTDRLSDFPLGVFGVAIATVVLPHLSRKNNDLTQFSKGVDWGIKLILLVGIPASIGLIFFARPIIATCFGYGKFSLIDILMTQQSLVMLASGIPAFMSVKILASGFYACQDIKTPVKCAAWSMLCNSILCAIFISPFRHAGLALASSLAGYLNCGLLFYFLNYKKLYKTQINWPQYLAKLLLANSCLAIFLSLLNTDASFWLNLPVLARLGKLLLDMLLAMAIYFFVLYILGLRMRYFQKDQL